MLKTKRKSGVRMLCLVLLLGGVSESLRAEPVGDSLTLFQREMLRASPAEQRPAAGFMNPAAEAFRQSFSLSELAVGYADSRRGEAALAQEGTGANGFGFEACSFIRTSERGRAFGTAGYTYGTRRDVRWSETSDFALLYPYVTADSVGGSLTAECYRFSGGYAHTTGTWTWGAVLDYRALLEYREVDPRPRNVVSDLQGSVAAARRVGNEYALSLAARGRKYGQRGDVAFYNEMYQAAIYHMTGLGMDYVRFAGVQTGSYYAGWGAGGTVELFPTAKQGFSAAVGYDYFTFRKEITGLNNLPLVTVADHAVRGVAGYRGRSAGLAWGVTARGELRRRSGTEHIFGDPVGNVYPEITTSEGYASQVVGGTVSGVVGNVPTAPLVWWVEPEFSYVDFRSEYASAGRRMDVLRWQTTVRGGVMRRWERWLVRAEAGITCSARGNGRLELPGADFSSSRIGTLEANYRYLTDAMTGVWLSARVERRLSGERSVFVRGGWGEEWYRASGAAPRWSAAVGFAF
ncbi:MAG TPA: hypothetical protein H9888_05915 [Candidatus Rikenella faecigallinarum]|uniref:DUF6850 domain-containing protein n=1 Tax=Candidatus Rikenella faecigallinarum TaxID=2838745 RepID=A0A9D1QEH3_9BACT|nr:hypothetical protein [Candidatus Rikenella faecigallinarum]